MAFGVKTGNPFDLLGDNDTENVEPLQAVPKQAEPKATEAAKPGGFPSRFTCPFLIWWRFASLLRSTSGYLWQYSLACGHDL